MSRIFACLIAFVSILHAEEPRTFTASDGRTLKATVVSKTDTHVTIRRAEDGQEFQLPLERLSAADRAFVLNQNQSKGSENKSEPLKGAFLDVPHIQQPPYLKHCSPAVVMMAFEGKTGLRLTVQDMLHVSDVVSQKLEDGSKGAQSAKVLPVLGMPVETRGFNPTKSKDLSAVLSMAQKGMDGYILPAMKNGGAVLLMVNSSVSTAHMVFLVGYNPSTNQFTIKDPAHTESYLLSKEELTRKWPCKYKSSGSFQLQAYTIKAPKARHSEYVKPADSKQLALDPETLSLIKTHDCASLEELTKLSPRFKWYDLAKFWEPGRDPQTVTGLAQALKLQIAAGRPVLVSSKVSDGGGFEVSCAHGYSGSYDDVRGTLTVKSQAGTKEIDNATLVGSCVFRDKSVSHLFIGFSIGESVLPE